MYGFHMILSVNSSYFLYTITELMFIMEKCCVFFELGAEFLNTVLMSLGFKGFSKTFVCFIVLGLCIVVK
jgi:hypothetical protein